MYSALFYLHFANTDGIAIMKTKLSYLSYCCLTSLSLSLFTANANANDVERIIVTGSRISQMDLETASPVTRISAEQIALSGISSVEELLQEVTATAGAAGNATNAYWTSNGYATAQVNLRGLGIKRTSVLLNGRRVVAGGTGANDSVDLNMIPVPLIKQIEILRDGASAIYGADAVAGVVNIITKEDFSGAELSIKAGATQEGDGENQELNLTLGGDFNKGNAVINFNYVNTGSVLQSSRNKCPLTEEDGKLVCFYSGSTIGGRARLADGSEVQFNQHTTGDGNGYEQYSNAENGYNWFEALNSYSPMKRFNVTSLVNYEVNENVQLNTELLYANRRSSQVVTPRSFAKVNVSKDFIYNPTGQDLTLKNRRNVEVEAPEFFQETNTIQANISLQGELQNDWFWQVSYSFGRNTATDGWSYDFDDEKVAQTLDMSQCSTDVGAAIPCGDYFGVGELNKDVIDYVTYRREGTGGNELRSWSASLSGDIMTLPAGELSFAVGVEQRDEKGWRNPDPIAEKNGEEDPISGSYKVREAYGELAIPVFKDRLFAKSVDLDFALRYTDNTTFDSELTYKLGATWRVNDEFMLRGVRSTAFRTPTITELFGGTNTENLITIDPCENASGVILVNCLAAGVPIDFKQDGSTIKTGVGGNPNLQPETADTLTLGLVWEPKFVDDLTFAVDYFDIKIDGAINSVAGSNTLRLCYTDPEKYKAYCDSFTRDEQSHQVSDIKKLPLNAANEHVAGIDFNTTFSSDVAGLNLDVNWDVTRLLKHENQAFADAEVEDLLGKITADRGIYAKWKSSVATSLSSDEWKLTYSIRYIGEAKDENGGGEIGKAVPSMFYHDMQFGYELSDNAKVAIGIDNLFNKKPPYLTSWNDANTDVFTYDTIGRRGYIKFNYQF